MDYVPYIEEVLPVNLLPDKMFLDTEVSPMSAEKKKISEAAAIRYRPGDTAPKVIAAGKGAVAEKIVQTAKENEVPLYQDPRLAHMLNLLQLGDEIPPELYEVVAQILIFIGDLDKYMEEGKKR